MTRSGMLKHWRGLFCAGVMAAALSAGPLAALAAEDAKATAPGKITFVGKNRLMTANGIFHAWKFTEVTLDLAAPAGGVIELEVDVASIDTKIAKRDDHLKTPDFFDTAKYPTATLRIHGVEAAGKSEAGNALYTASLDWEMHGVEKTYKDFEFEVTGSNPAQVKGTFEINRMDFKIGEPYSKLNPMSIQEGIPITFVVALPDAL